MANVVKVSFGVLSRSRKSMSGFDDDGRRAWRIDVQFPDRTATISIAFARKHDAEQGMKSLQRLMTFEGTYNEVRERIRDIGPQRIRRAVCEAMAW